MEQLLQAEEWRAARARDGTGSAPCTPQGVKALMLGAGAGESAPSTADTEVFDGSRMLVGRAPSGPSTPRGSDRFAEGSIEQEAWQEVFPGISANATESALTPLERRNLRQPSPRGPKPPLPASFAALAGACGASGAHVPPRSAPTMTTANALDVGCEIPRARTASASVSPSRSAAQRGELTATTRLRERMRQREGSAVAPRAQSPLGFGGGTGTGGSDWQARIEARQRETEELQEMEAQHRQQTDERSCRRNEALRKVQERQAQRQQEVEGLEV